MYEDMRLLVLMSGLIATAVARPEPPLSGYNYPSPIPQPVGNPLVSGHLQTTTFPFLGNFGNGDFGSQITNFNLPGLGVHADSSGAIPGSHNDYSSGTAVIQSGAPTIHKHVYVHVAPEEPEEIRQRKPVLVSAPQKHYKIIFIKAPAPPKSVAPIIPVQPQNEENTLVYVLVKKPEEASEIHIPTPAPTQPSKPEVYFIKYGTKKEQIESGNIIKNEPNNLVTHSKEAIQAGDILTNGLNSLNAHSVETPSFGEPSGFSFGPSVGPSVDLTNSVSFGDSSSQLAASVGVTNSAGIAPKYGPPGFK